MWTRTERLDIWECMEWNRVGLRFSARLPSSNRLDRDAFAAAQEPASAWLKYSGRTIRRPGTQSIA